MFSDLLPKADLGLGHYVYRPRIAPAGPIPVGGVKPARVNALTC